MRSTSLALGALPRRRTLCALAGLSLVLIACGPKHHLADYNFAGRSMAMIYMAPHAPLLLTNSYDLRGADNPVEAVIFAGSNAAKEVEARKANVRLDSALARVDIAGRLAQQTLERSSRYLGVRPVETRDDADYLLEVHMRSFGIDARGQSAASLFTNAEVVLLDARTGREIWSLDVQGTDRLTPVVRGSEGLPGSIIAAGTLSAITVEQFQHALEQLMQLSSNVVADELREALRDARKR
jgi:hypothetical protein